MVGDDVNHGPLPIGFRFPFYGDTMSSFRVCTNGFVSLTSSFAGFGNVALPNNGSGVPENLLAVFWDDLTFGSTPRAYYHSDGSRLVIQYQDVARLGETGHPNTFEIILHADGTIVYQYLSMGAQVMNSNSIGIQNGARNDGLGVAFNAPYARDLLAVRFRPPARWLTVDPASGSVPPGGTLDLTVGFDASDLDEGFYQGHLRLVGNDAAVHDVFVSLLVQQIVANVGDAALLLHFALGLAGANPGHGEARLALALPRGGALEVEVFDVRGARLRRLAAGPFEPGFHTLRWDGRDDAGRPAPPGLYFVRAVSGNERARPRFTLIR